MSGSGAIQDIPSIPGWPVLGNAIDLRYRRLDLLARVQRECGSIGRLRLGRRDVVVLSDPELAHELLVEKADDFVKSRTLGHFAKPLLGRGLLSSEHELHRHQRGLMAPVFPHARVVGWVDDMASKAEQAQDTWADGQAIDVSQQMMELTLEIVASTLFGADLGDEAAELGAAITIANRYVAREGARLVHLPSWVPTPGSIRNRTSIRRLDATVHRMIAARRRAPREGGDLLSS